MEKILNVSNIRKKYGNKAALDDISFQMEQGEVLGLVGPNGAGKTTLMKILVGLIRNYEGEVLINGVSIRENTKRKDKLIGCVIDHPKFYPYLSGYENLKYFANLSGGFHKKNIDSIIEVLGLSSFINKKTNAYSMGMKQRLGIAQALVNDPKLLILDEPTNGLDVFGINEIRKYLRDISENKNIPILVSSHDLTEIEKMCHRVLAMQNGKIIKTIHLDDKEANISDEVQYIINAGDIGKVIKLLQLMDVSIINTSDSEVLIKTRKEKIPSIISMLAKNEVIIYAVNEQILTLEKQFFDLIGENVIE